MSPILVMSVRKAVVVPETGATSGSSSCSSIKEMRNSQ
ncbi:thiopeptide-type bacteriocin [Arthrobacter sp. CAN_A212]